MTEKIKGIVLAGGGILGISHIGAYKMLEQSGYKFDYFVGSSIGAFIASLLACRADANLLETIMYKLDYSKILDQSNLIAETYNLLEHNGLHSIDGLKKMYQKVIKKVCGNEGITFSQIYTTYKSHLAMTATDLFNSSTVYFDQFNSPNMSVAEACVYSASVPFLFESDRYVDGGLLDNYPLNYLKKMIGINSIIGLNFSKSTQNIPINDKPSFYNFSKEIIKMIIEKAFQLYLTSDELTQTIFIDVPNIDSFDFNLTNQQKQILYQCGVDAVKNSHFSLN